MIKLKLCSRYFVNQLEPKHSLYYTVSIMDVHDDLKMLVK